MALAGPKTSNTTDQDPLGLVAITQLHSLMHTGGGTGGHGSAEGALVGKHIGLNSGVATRVQDLAAHNLDDLGRSVLEQLLGLRTQPTGGLNRASRTLISARKVSTHQEGQGLLWLGLDGGVQRLLDLLLRARRGAPHGVLSLRYPAPIHAPAQQEGLAPGGHACQCTPAIVGVMGQSAPRNQLRSIHRSRPTCTDAILMYFGTERTTTHCRTATLGVEVTQLSITASLHH